MQKTNLTKLAELTKSLPHLGNLIKRIDGNTLHFTTKHGNIEARIVYKNSNITIMQVVATKDSIFEKHTHKESETIHVYEGKIKIDINGQTVTVCQHESILIPPDSPHLFNCVEDCRVMVVLMPADEELSKCQ